MTISKKDLNPGTELFEYAMQKGLAKDTEDFYENKHINSDLLSINFTQNSDEQIYEALYKANMRLIHRYQELQMENSERICDDLYHNKNGRFRGFRQSQIQVK